MRFGNLDAFWFLVMVPLGIVFYFWAFHRKQRKLGEFGNPKLMEKLTSATSWARQGSKAAMIITGFSSWCWRSVSHSSAQNWSSCTGEASTL